MKRKFKVKEAFNPDEFIHLKGNLYASNQQIADSYHKVMNNKTPCGYNWCEFGGPEDVEFELEGWLKEGQASTGNVYERITLYGNLRPQLLVDIVIDNVFKIKGFDQKLLTWRSDLKKSNEKDIEYDPRSSAVRSTELLQYLTLEAFQTAPSRRREAIRKMTDNDQAGRVDLDVRASTVEVLLRWMPNITYNLNNTVYDLYELCARFGKTLFSLICFAIWKGNTMVFTAYYQSAFGSILNEVSTFKQFSNMRVVDARKRGAQVQYKRYIKQGFKVVIICGLHTQSIDKWKRKYAWVNKIKNKLCFGDEIDFGMTTGRTSPLVEFLFANGYVGLLTGSNGEKAYQAFGIRKHEEYSLEQLLTLKQMITEDESYAKLLFKDLVKQIKLHGDSSYTKMLLKGLTVKAEIDIPEIGVWQRTVLGQHDMGFQKVAHDPDKHSGIIVKDTEVLLGADDEFAHLSLNSAISQQNTWWEQNGINANIELPTPFAMIEFVSYNTNIRKKGKLSKSSVNMLKKYADYRQQGCNNSGKKIKVINVDGTCKHIRTNYGRYNKGDAVKIQDCEHYVNDHLALAKEQGYEGIWIIASQYCQRSFTVGKVYVVMLSYDRGDEGRTKQCISRYGSPEAGKTGGLIISNSFNAVRDEKSESFLLDMARARAKRTGETLIQAMKQVKRAHSIFRLDDNGDAIQLKPDEYLAELATGSNRIQNETSRKITNAIITKGMQEKFIQGVQRKKPKGEELDSTHKPGWNEGLSQEELAERNRKNRSAPHKTPQEERDNVKIFRVVQNIVENIDIVNSIGDHNLELDIIKSLENICNYTELKEEFVKQYNVDPENILAILSQDIELEELTSISLSSIIVKARKREEQQMKELFDV